jgi:hypothetical protein
LELVGTYSDTNAAAPLFEECKIEFEMVISTDWIQTVVLVLLALYVLSGSDLNFSASNLCYKKIQTKRPYAIVRHPATSFKLLYLFLAFFR